MKEEMKSIPMQKAVEEAVNLAKSVLLNTINHEIRTPMNAIVGMSELLQGTKLTEEQRNYAKAIYANTNSLLHTINGILDFSKIKAGQLEIENLHYDLRIALKDMIEMFVIEAQRKKVKFNCNIDPEVPSWVIGDPGRLRQILINLTENAFKYTKKGYVNIAVSVKTETETDIVLHFEVEDSGIGISKNQLEEIFQSFSQVDSSSTRESGGIGLGLTISRQLVELMKGTIGVKSEEGKGSVFWFELTLQKQQIQDEMNVRNDLSIADKHILIVDSNELNRQIIGAYLKPWGCLVKEATSAEEALSLLREHVKNGIPFDMLIADDRMPKMDGESLGRIIKSDPTITNTILLLLTFGGSKGDAAKMKNIGFSAYLTKPIKRIHFDSCLRKLFSSKNSAIKEKGNAAIITRFSLAEEVKRNAKILIVEDNLINQKIVTKLLNRLGFTSDIAENGQEAINALSNIDYKLVLMDIQMPVMDGIEATKQIRSNSDSRVLNPNIPIIAVTALASKEGEKRCYDAGMNDFISKPINYEKFVTILENRLKLS